MLSRETLESYRRMTLSERLQLAIQMSEDAARQMLEGPKEVVARRFELLRVQNDDRNNRMLTAIARTKRPAE